MQVEAMLFISILVLINIFSLVLLSKFIRLQRKRSTILNLPSISTSSKLQSNSISILLPKVFKLLKRDCGVSKSVIYNFEAKKDAFILIGFDGYVNNPNLSEKMLLSSSIISFFREYKSIIHRSMLLKSIKYEGSLENKEKLKEILYFMDKLDAEIIAPGFAKTRNRETILKDGVLKRKVKVKKIIRGMLILSKKSSNRKYSKKEINALGDFAGNMLFDEIDYSYKYAQLEEGYSKLNILKAT